ncbi:peptidase T domain protein, partial [Vibrio parahaemolyticus AQ3810]
RGYPLWDCLALTSSPVVSTFMVSMNLSL